MKNPKRVWFTSDLHLDHHNILAYTGRPWSNVMDMNDAIINNINSVVKKTDTLWVLGDFALATLERVKEFTERIQCADKRLVMGNHDKHKLSKYYECGWNRVYDMPVVFEEFILLSHKPRFIEKNSVLYCLSGHSHNSTPHILSRNQMNVSVEVTDYYPVSLQYVLEVIKGEGGHPDEL